MTDFVLILTRKAAVEAFSKGGNLKLGGNVTVAAGPLGRNVEGDVSVRSPAAIYTYSKTKGLFAGISIEGSYLIERKDANKKLVLPVALTLI
jgi:SH3 domain-containing YSC84-like protein 1